MTLINKTNLLNSAFGALLATQATLLAPSIANAETGYTTKTINVPHRDVSMRLDIYFPAKENTETVLHGKNAVFNGIELAKDAKPRHGKFPVILFSHGSGGNGINTGWIGKAFADRGMIFIAPNHPGTTSRDSHPSETVKTWERPQDMSSIIDQLPNLLPKGMQPNTDKIGAVGFSLGGYTVLALAGAEISKAAFIKHCDKSMDTGLNECGWLTKDGLDLNDTDKERFEQSNSDPRIKTVVSVDPGLAAAFTTDSLQKIERPIKIINLGSSGTIYSGIDGKPVAEAISGAQYYQVENSSHFSFLGTCTKIGPEILKAEKEDPICTEMGGRDRHDIHSEITKETVKFVIKQFALTN